jgi:hypothetical protein
VPRTDFWDMPMNTFAIETIMLLPYVYWLKMMKAHQEYFEDLIYA